MPLHLVLSPSLPGACPPAHASPALQPLIAQAAEDELAWEIAVGAMLVWAVRQGASLYQGYWAEAAKAGLLPAPGSLTSVLCLSLQELRNLQVSVEIWLSRALDGVPSKRLRGDGVQLQCSIPGDRWKLHSGWRLGWGMHASMRCMEGEAHDLCLD